MTTRTAKSAKITARSRRSFGPTTGTYLRRAGTGVGAVAVVVVVAAASGRVLIARDPRVAQRPDSYRVL